MHRSLCAVALVCLVASAAPANPIKRTLDPAVSPDGKTVAFIWQGDVWSVPVGGGEATRLTVHPANESFPHWSRDGKRIVFSSNRFGNLDLFSMDARGGNVERLNFESSNEYCTSIGPDGTVYGYSTAWGRMDLFKLPTGVRDIVRITSQPMELEYYADVSPNGQKMVFNTAGSPSNWRSPGKAGANTAEVWSAPASGVPLTGMKQLTKNDSSDLFPVYLDDNTLLVVSNRDGAPNVWQMNSDGGAAKKLTNFVSGTIRALSASAAGRVAVFQRNSEMWTLDLGTNKAQPVPVSAPGDSRRMATVEITPTTAVSDFVVSPNGKLAVAAARGDLFLLPATGGTTRLLTKNVRPDSNPQWIDDETLIYIAAGEKSFRSLRTLKLDGTSKPFYTAEAEVLAPMVSPDRKWVAFHVGNRSIQVLPIGGGEAKTVFQGDFSAAYYGSPSFAWTPDSAYISLRAQGQRSVGLYLVPVAGGEPVEISRVGKEATVPVVTGDGMYFVYGGIQGLDYSEIRESSTPFYSVALQPDPVTFGEDDLDKINEKPTKPEGAVAVKIVKEGLSDRLSKSALDVNGVWAAPGGDTVYANIDGQFSTIDVSSRAARPVAGVTGAVGDVLFNNGRVFVNQRGTMSLLSPQGLSPIRISGSVRVDQGAEDMALFEEAWWALRNLFYDPAMHGKNWDAIREEFAAIVPYCTSRADFYDLMGELVERLDSSHQGATNSDPYRPEVSESTGWLGVEWDWAAMAQGRYVVASLYTGSPGLNPDTKLVPGDQIVEIDGVALGKSSSMAELMRGKTGRKVALKVNRAGTTLDVTIKPIPSGLNPSFAMRDWIKWNKAEVNRLSNGKLGYIHIQGMDEPSLDTFLTEICTEMEGKQGLVVDVRYNGGGYTGHIILNVMRKVPWLIRTGRDLPGAKFSENAYRGNALETVAACLTNEYSFSNAEIFSEGFRRMELGPIVGEPTGGGVIGTSSYPLFDGGAIRMPAGGAYTIDGENLEGKGRKPDFNINWDPNAWLQGRDLQLEKAVAELMKRIGPG